MKMDLFRYCQKNMKMRFFNKRIVMKNKCACGNVIDFKSMGDGAKNCVWCEYPETPMYKITDLNDVILLAPLGLGDDFIKLDYKDITVYSWDENTASMILEDYLRNVVNV